MLCNSEYSFAVIFHFLKNEKFCQLIIPNNKDKMSVQPSVRMILVRHQMRTDPECYRKSIEDQKLIQQRLAEAVRAEESRPDFKGGDAWKQAMERVRIYNRDLFDT
jgi:hypothetical protein